MIPRFDYGVAVRVIRNLRNDGTYPGLAIGELLMRRGRVGYVRNVGSFLQDQIIYEVHFLDEDRVVGCREEELIDADAPWIPSRFETRERIATAVDLSVEGRVIVPRGETGEVLRVIREYGSVAYEVRFPGRTLMVPERGLASLNGETAEEQRCGGGG